MNDDELHLQLRKGSTDALECIMKQYMRLLWSIAGAILKNNGTLEDIEECVSDVFTELWRKPSGYNPKKGSLRTYLALLTKSRALNTSKRLRRKQTIPLDETESPVDTGEIFSVTADDAAQRAVGLLPEPDREIFIRRHILGQKPDAIAHATGLTTRQVTNKLYRVRGKLKVLLNNLEESV